MYRLKYVLIFLLITSSVHSQTQVTGVVINGEDNSKLPSASVFINNSSKGTTTNSEGKFIIPGITETNFELVISYTGFKTESLKITPGNINNFHTIKLYPREVNLKEIKIMAPVREGWETWGRLFTENFIGTSDFALECKIENPEMIRFYYDKETKVLKAYSHGNLIIHNRLLGYDVRYQLEEFLYDIKSRFVSYSGYTNFEDLNRNSIHKVKRWERNRREAYKDSLMHFLRSVYHNTTESEGFEIRQKIRIPDSTNTFNEIYRDGKIPQMITVDTNHYTPVPAPVKPGSRPGYIDLVDKNPFSLKNNTRIDTSTRQMIFYFAGVLKVVYKNGKEKSEYLVQNRRPLYTRTYQASEIFLIDDEPMIVEATGAYFNPLKVATSGYWGWCKMAEMLPLDYKFEEEKN